MLKNIKKYKIIYANHACPFLYLENLSQKTNKKVSSSLYLPYFAFLL